MFRLMVWLILFVLTCLAGALTFTLPSEARPLPGDSLSFEFRGEYRGAFHDSKAAWNRLAQREGAPVLWRPSGGRPPELVIESRCKPHGPVGHVSGGSASGAGPRVLWVNRCAGLSWQERRMVYSHELGHVYNLEHVRGLSVMREDLGDQRALYPTPKDGRALGREW